MNKPNFFLLGAAKCGTTTLYDYLKQHPNIYMSEPKEPRFLERLDIELDYQHYWQTYFKGWQGESIIGEASPRNLYFPYMPERLKQYSSDAKLLVILRNPIERLHSAWWMNVTSNVETYTFEEAVAESYKRLTEEKTNPQYWNETTPVKYRWYLEMGHYAEQIEKYLTYFSKKQIFILFLEDVVKDPQQELDKIWRFLEVDRFVVTAIQKSKNSALPSFTLPWINLVKRTGLETVVPRAIKQQVKGILSKPSNKPQINTELKQWLLEYYKPHNQKLAYLTKRKLANWTT